MFQVNLKQIWYLIFRDMEPTMVKRGHYRRVTYLNYLQKEIQMPERNLSPRLDQSLYQEFDEKKGYTFTIV